MTQPWIASYPDAVPHTIDVTAYRSLVDLLDERQEQDAERIAYSNFATTLTYRDVYRLSHDVAAYLQHELGLKRGDRVAIMLPNLLQYPVALLGVLRAGCVVVNVNPLYTATEVTHQLNDADVTAIVVATNFAATVEQALPDTPSLKHIIVTDVGDLLGRVKGAVFNVVSKYIKKIIPAWKIPHAIPFKTVLRHGAKQTLSNVELTLDDLAFLQYTGGTTGTAKGAMLTHRNMVANTLQCTKWIDYMFNQDDVVLVALPMYHIYSLTVCCLTFSRLGATCLLITNPRDMPTFIKTLKKNKVSMFVGISTLFKGLLKQPEFAKLDFSQLRVSCHGGMVIQPDVSKQWEQITGVPIVDGYGLTEASPVVTMNPVAATVFNGSIGLPIPSTDVVIRDEAGCDLAVGKVGEICVRGPQVMAGYWRQPQETANVIDADGWLATGDIGCLADDGFIKLVDRKKDMILVSGFNVYPSDIESVLASCRGIMESAVVGVPCDKTGEAVKAFVVRDDPLLSQQDILEFCKTKLTRYKLPKQIEFCDTLPKSHVGKILKRELRDTPVAMVE
ncbi:MAG: long-chain-fatty-acid--CoA ligase [Coxiella sp. (in: Bacteria)]|nr:MAG: long-chain-fatty-acid--CoA ligase [Coxiella sp. (in: g-proteobacteria)]